MSFDLVLLSVSSLCTCINADENNDFPSGEAKEGGSLLVPVPLLLEVVKLPAFYNLIQTELRWHTYITNEFTSQFEDWGGGMLVCPV